MLVLSRRQNELVQIGDNIYVKIIRTARGSVKIGIDAPDGMRVLRGEVEDRDLVIEAPAATAPLAPLARRLEKRRVCEAV
ncbi:MAG: carbon storage regulator [Planctomycetaceae bacterium]|nr:carbon storage regulator [Planctomycetaceae bacterium]